MLEHPPVGVKTPQSSSSIIGNLGQVSSANIKKRGSLLATTNNRVTGYLWHTTIWNQAFTRMAIVIQDYEESYYCITREDKRIKHALTFFFQLDMWNSAMWMQQRVGLRNGVISLCGIWRDKGGFRWQHYVYATVRVNQLYHSWISHHQQMLFKHDSDTFTDQLLDGGVYEYETCHEHHRSFKKDLRIVYAAANLITYMGCAGGLQAMIPNDASW